MTARPTLHQAGANRGAELVDARTPLVSVRDLHVEYVRRRRSAPAVRGLDLDIRPGETVALVGESGSGKSTIADAIIGLLPDNATISAGQVLVAPTATDSAAGRLDVVSATEVQRQHLRGRVIGLIPQDPMVGLNPTQRIGVQVAEAVRLCGVDRRHVGAEVLAYLQRAGIDDPELRAGQYPHELSGGLRQRVLIAIALAGEPQLIIADEPTSALDVTVQAKILDHLENLVLESGIALLIITHDLAVAADRSDRVVVLQHGRIVEQGSPSDILVAPREPYTRRLIAAAPGLAHDGRIVPCYPTVESTPSDEAPILVLTDVSKDYGSAGRGTAFRALDEVSVTVARGRTHALVGESGSGKTTTARIALGLERPDSGRVVLDGTDITGLRWRQTRHLRQRVQLVHQNPFSSLDPRFTIGQTVTEPLVSFGIGNRRARSRRAVELLDQVSLPTWYLDRLPGELSGGQRQRVAIARALALEPELVLLDEPVSALDVSVQQQILDLLTELQTRLGVSYLFISHDLSVVAQISHTVSVLSRGRVVESGTVAAVFGRPISPFTHELIDAIPGQRAARGRTGRAVAGV